MAYKDKVVLGDCTLILGDCLEVMKDIPDKSIDAVITDPPYPDYYIDLYKYDSGRIKAIEKFSCVQLVFWSKLVDFILDFTAIHIWNKNPSNHGAQYERIFERNGKKQFKVFTYYMVNSTVAAQMTNDVFINHPSQKPINLIRKLVEDYSKPIDTILDPFMGSGTTGVACVQTGRKFIGIEISEQYFNIAVERIRKAQQQMRLPFDCP